MLVSLYLHNTYNDIFGELSGILKEKLDEHVWQLVEYGKRNGVVLKDCKRENIKVSRVFDDNGLPCDVLVEDDIWPLERHNIDNCKLLDQLIADKFRILGKHGIHNISVVLYERFLRKIYSADFDKWLLGNQTTWRGVFFVYQRLMSTARLAARYSRGDLFGDIVLRDKDGNIENVCNSKVILRSEMEKRKILTKR